MTDYGIPVIIPSYEPDQRLIKLLLALVPVAPGPVILVDDGSGPAYRQIFEEAEKLVQESGGCLITHVVNRGKGRALKTAFFYIVMNLPHVVGAVTADSDGQHSPDCILRVAEELRQHPDALILGVRTFEGEDVPWKSAAGNKITSSVLEYLTGMHIIDTQTGLRGIPISFMRELLTVKGERFEFEMRMLLEATGRYPIRQVPIRTIYDSRTDHQTHFHPVRDSVQIYSILGERFLKCIFSSLSSAVLDLALFAVFGLLLKGIIPASYILTATILARILSCGYNYAINYKFVFHSREKVARAAGKYFLLAAAQMLCSGLIVSGFSRILPGAPAVAIKAITDTGLFFVSYRIQQQVVFAEGGRDT